MADNVAITAGVGTTIATDEVSGAHFQRVKLDLGVEGSSDPCETFVPVQFHAPTQVTGTITANGQSVEISTEGYNLVTLQFHGTYGSVAIQYQGTLDETNWQLMRGFRANTITVETASGTQTNVTRFIFIPTYGMKKIRVNSTTYGSGTMNIRLCASNATNGWGGFTLT